MGGLRTGIRPVHIVATSKMVCDYSGMMVQPHKVSHFALCLPAFISTQDVVYPTSSGRKQDLIVVESIP